MAGEIKHKWNGTVLTIISDSGTSSCDLKGAKGDDGCRGPQGRTGITLTSSGEIDTSGLATEQYVDEKIASVSGAEVDLSNYYTKAETVALIPDLTGYAKKTEIPDVSGFITEIPSEYITETELNAKGYLTQHQSLEDYATKQYVTDAIANIDVSGSVDLSGYALKTEIPDVSGFQTEAQVNALINTAIANITDGEAVSY